MRFYMLLIPIKRGENVSLHRWSTKVCHYIITVIIPVECPMNKSFVKSTYKDTVYSFLNMSVSLILENKAAS